MTARSLLFVILAFAFGAQNSKAFNSPAVMPPTAAAFNLAHRGLIVPSNALFVRHSIRSSSSSPLFMASSSEEEAASKEEPDDAIVAAVVVSPDAEEGKANTEDKRSKGGLSLIPLVLKFCVVLCVKFITDVLVFPPLFLYRLVRLVYRRFLALIGGGGSSKKDGATSS
mmetsp:Transcript_18881/g.31216  ORF Transcript_18881/g.31216 Transcript_18881/m.31216 type:complete len:169 (+) Transcript_18881:123-629(+)|eukprot:CAMPEP_0119019340 /NCGR_PEP_ID=MMETSP1176-20130426/21550_1 /TAXON_ID=265551 /ORGANISM="Synedropsis recta cf, Strain CCMP1620" /LENGTH=168 /DNA_ID=CAMNT_0006973513 /DNA_START=78 /DNA_END=584 /DNA_ORIENTATION=-